MLRRRGRARARGGAVLSAPLSVIDLFAGAGGLSLGFEQAGFAPALGTDADDRAAAAYASNFPCAPAMTADAATLSGGELLDEAGLTRCDVAIGGPPCQGFSAGGKRRPGDPRRGAITEFGRLVRETGADRFVMENVPGLLFAGAKTELAAFLEAMRRGGYAAEVWLLDAERFGVPQKRRRAFVVGARRGLAVPVRPEPPGGPPPSTREAIGDLEHVGAIGRVHGAAPGRYAARMRGEERDPADRSEPRPPPFLLSGCELTGHSSAVTERFGAVRPGERDPVSRFHRLHPDRPAPTLRAGTFSGKPGNGGHTAPRPIHYAFPRCITVREALRLQGIPDWFRVDPEGETRWRGFMQAGNAVPPPLARAVAEAVRDAASTDGRSR